MKALEITDSPKNKLQPPTNNDGQTISCDLSAVVDLPAPYAEAAIHVALDQITELGETHPLEALDCTLELLQKFNMELCKCYMPAVVAGAQQFAMIAQNPLAAQTMKVSQHLTKEQGRSIGAMAQLQEAIAKIGVARVKTRDELVRRRKRKT